MEEMENLINSKIIYLYRHGETNWNIENKVMGQLEGINTYFTDTGYNQIGIISKEIKKNNIEAIYCSDFKRTFETANIANKKLGIPIYSCKEVRGLNMGKYQGMLFSDFIKDDEVRSCFFNHDLMIGNGESINQLNDRIIKFIKKISIETKYKKIAIITHSAVISNLKAYLSNDKYVSLCKCTLLFKDNELSVLDYKSNYDKE